MGRGACVVAQGDYWAGLKGRQAFARRMRRRACCAKCKSRGQGLPATREGCAHGTECRVPWAHEGCSYYSFLVRRATQLVRYSQFGVSQSSGSAVPRVRSRGGAPGPRSVRGRLTGSGPGGMVASRSRRAADGARDPPDVRATTRIGIRSRPRRTSSRIMVWRASGVPRHTLYVFLPHRARPRNA